MVWKSKRKGLSPLIGAVLLIVFTVAVGTIVLSWMTSYTKKTTNKAGTDTTNVVECAKEIISITKVGYVDGTNNNTIFLYVTNKGTKETTLEGAYAFDNEGNTCSNTSLSTQLGSVRVGGVVQVTINNCANVNNDTFTVRVSNTCGRSDEKVYPTDFES